MSELIIRKILESDLENGFLESLDNPLVVIVSDHGQIAGHEEIGRINVFGILEQSGLLAYKGKSEEDGSSPFDHIAGPSMEADWTKIKAFPQRSCHIYVNLKGRDPDGIVEAKDYEKTRDEIIAALLEYKHPKTGKNPFSIVIRKEHAKMMGCYGDKVGDVIYSIKPGYTIDEHGDMLPTAEYGIGSMEAITIVSGPNIKHNYKINSSRWLIDIAPTISYLLDLPTPKDAEGSIMYDILEDPDFKIKKTIKLQRDLEKWKKGFERLSAITHTHV